MAKNGLSVKTGDTVVVISGKDAGKQGKVLAVNVDKKRVAVDGVNIVAHHKKPKSAQDKGGIVKSEGTIDVSNVMIVCPICGKATRVHHNIVDGKSVRVCKCGAVLDKKFEKVSKKIDKKVEKSTDKTADKADKAVKTEKTAVKTSKPAEKNTKIKATATKTKADRVVAKVKRGDV